MKNRRPNGWDNPWLNPVDTGGATVAVPSFTEVYEAGADAILEALRDEGVQTDTYFWIDWPPLAARLKLQGRKGKIVFIPDEGANE